MSEVDYSFGENEDTPPGEENRREYRLTGNARVLLEVESAAPDSSDDDSSGRVLTFHTRDLSPTGLRVTSNEPLPQGALFPAGIELSGEHRTYDLTMEVVWCRESGDGRWLAGLRILESDDTAYIDWLDAMARAMGED